MDQFVPAINLREYLQQILPPGLSKSLLGTNERAFIGNMLYLSNSQPVKNALDSVIDYAEAELHKAYVEINRLQNELDVANEKPMFKDYSPAPLAIMESFKEVCKNHGAQISNFSWEQKGYDNCLRISVSMVLPAWKSKIETDLAGAAPLSPDNDKKMNEAANKLALELDKKAFTTDDEETQKRLANIRRQFEEQINSVPYGPPAGSFAMQYDGCDETLVRYYGPLTVDEWRRGVDRDQHVGQPADIGQPVALTPDVVKNAWTSLIIDEPIGMWWDGYKQVPTPQGYIMPVVDSDAELKARWKKDGKCLKCGDKGEMRGMSAHCRSHGLIWGC